MRRCLEEIKLKIKIKWYVRSDQKWALVIVTQLPVRVYHKPHSEITADRKRGSPCNAEAVFEHLFDQKPKSILSIHNCVYLCYWLEIITHLHNRSRFQIYRRWYWKWTALGSVLPWTNFVAFLGGLRHVLLCGDTTIKSLLSRIPREEISIKSIWQPHHGRLAQFDIPIDAMPADGDVDTKCVWTRGSPSSPHRNLHLFISHQITNSSLSFPSRCSFPVRVLFARI